MKAPSLRIYCNKFSTNSSQKNKRGSRNYSYLLQVSLFVLALTLIAAIVILASVPPVSRDALTHHLFVPKLYLQRGAIYEIPEIQVSYYPMNLELLYLLPLYFKNDILPKYIHFSFALLTACFLYNYLRKRLNSFYASFGALFFLSVPIIIKLSTTVYVDLGLICFTTASMLLVFQWYEKGFQYKYLVLSGISCGLAAGTKYNGLISLFIVSLLIPACYSKFSTEKSSGKAIGFYLFFIAIALFICSPWLIRNYIWTANPLYPLFTSIFPSNSTLIAEPTVSSLFIRRSVFHESWLDILLIPLRIFFTGQDNSPQYFDGKLNPFLFLLPLLAFFHKPEEKIIFEKNILLTFSILYVLIVFFKSDMRIRYIAPIIPFLVILSCYGLFTLFSYPQSTNLNSNIAILKYLAWLLPVLILVYNGYYLFQLANVIRPFDYLKGDLTRNQYINRYVAEYPLVTYTNNNLPLQTKILAIFIGNRGYYFEHKVLFDLQSNTSKLCDIVENATSAEDVLEAIQRLKITHILIRYDMFNRWIIDNLNLREQHLLKLFFRKHTKKIAEKNNHGLFAIMNNA